MPKTTSLSIIVVKKTGHPTISECPEIPSYSLESNDIGYKRIPFVIKEIASVFEKNVHLQNNLYALFSLDNSTDSSSSSIVICFKIPLMNL